MKPGESDRYYEYVGQLTKDELWLYALADESWVKDRLPLWNNFLTECAKRLPIKFEDSPYIRGTHLWKSKLGPRCL